MLDSDLLFNAIRPEEGFYTSEVACPDRLPVRTFLPTGYEPGYAYPLLVFFHGHGSNEEQMIRLAPRLSRRNFICISVRGPQLIDIQQDGRFGYSWGPDDASDAILEDYVFQAIDMTAECYNVNMQRIYLAGVCQGASLAYRLGLTFSDRFAGIISLNGCMPRWRRPLLRYPDVKRLNIFIGHGIANSIVPLSLARNDFKLLYSAGVSVQFRQYPTTHRLHTEMLRDTNRWVISHCDQPVCDTIVR